MTSKYSSLLLKILINKRELEYILISSTFLQIIKNVLLAKNKKIQDIFLEHVLNCSLKKNHYTRLRNKIPSFNHFSYEMNLKFKMFLKD